MLYAPCQGERSSRQIDRRCREDAAYRMSTANTAPGHAVIARFRTGQHRDQKALKRPWGGLAEGRSAGAG
ncbi:hypothetical protein [Streptomyces humicola]|uniref:hypothetical protein n=1 Tax=Streptomyces humicola TaxID=2953240 RepID=UPI003558E0B9